MNRGGFFFVLQFCLAGFEDGSGGDASGVVGVRRKNIKTCIFLNFYGCFGLLESSSLLENHNFRE